MSHLVEEEESSGWTPLRLHKSSGWGASIFLCAFWRFGESSSRCSDLSDCKSRRYWFWNAWDNKWEVSWECWRQHQGARGSTFRNSAEHDQARRGPYNFSCKSVALRSPSQLQLLPDRRTVVGSQSLLICPQPFQLILYDFALILRVKFIHPSSLTIS